MKGWSQQQHDSFLAIQCGVGRLCVVLTADVWGPLGYMLKVRDAAWPGAASRDLVGKVSDTGRDPQKDLGPLGLILDILKLINMD